MSDEPATNQTPTTESGRSPARHRVVILGGGFGGLMATHALRKANVDVVLVDKCNFHLFQPLLYQVATGGLSPANIASPLRRVLRRQRNARVVLAEATGIDPASGTVHLLDGALPYDTLIVATGAGHNYFGHDDWADHAPGLKTVDDATEIRRRLFLAFEAAERETDPDHIAALLTFVVVGAGPTGVELAGAIAEISHDTLRRDFRNIDPTRARVVLVEGTDRVLGSFAPRLSEKAREALAKLAVDVRVNTFVTDIAPDHVSVKAGDATETIASHTVFWAAGVQASPLGRLLADATGAEVDRAGRVLTERDCSVKGHPDVFVIGDLGCYLHDAAFDNGLPGVAQVALQQGTYVGQLVASRQRGTKPPRRFRYKDKGSMATIGRNSAVAQTRLLKLSGYPAWLMWLFVHVMYLIEFENRVLVMMQWAWNYWTFNRSARLITGPRSYKRMIKTETGSINLGTTNTAAATRRLDRADPPTGSK